MHQKNRSKILNTCISFVIIEKKMKIGEEISIVYQAWNT
jgi:hypothetical protein